MLECLRLRHRFGDTLALKDLSFSLGTGEIGGLLGLNGAGKSTAMSILATLLPPTEGTASVAGHDVVRERHKIRPILGFQQETNEPPLPWWTPYEVLSYFSRCFGLSQREADERIRDLSGVLALETALHRPTRTLSGGTRRKVELARALLHRPRVLLLDEPTREMDIPTKRQVWSMLERLAQEGTTILIASHDALEIQRLCTTVCVLREGAVVYHGSMETLDVPARPGDVDARLADLLSGGASA